MDWIADRLARDRKPIAAGFSDRVLRRVAQQRPERARVHAPRGSWQWAPVAAGLLLAVGLSVAGWMREGVARQAAGPLRGTPQVTVELELADVAARTVAVAGDFNGWGASQMKQGSDGVWRVRLKVQPGRYQYAFVVDGEKWMADPRSSTVVDSGFSGANSVLDVSL